MSVRPSSVRRAAPLAVLSVLLPLLSGCGPSRDEFAPACPAAQLAPPTDQVVIYRPNSSGHDLINQVLQGQVAAIHGQCRNGSAKGTLDLAVSVTFDFVRGPAMQGNSVSVPVFIAVTEGDHILDKRVYAVDAAFPANVQRVSRTSTPVEMRLPLEKGKSGAAYTVLAGFQLTRDQLAASRGHGER